LNSEMRVSIETYASSFGLARTAANSPDSGAEMSGTTSGLGLKTAKPGDDSGKRKALTRTLASKTTRLLLVLKDLAQCLFRQPSSHSFLVGVLG